MIYLMRHGERGIQKFCNKYGDKKLFVDVSNMSDAKRQKTYSRIAHRILNDRLTNVGKKQVRDSIPHLSSLNINRIITSTHYRCVQTSNIIARALNIPVVYEPRFCERTPYYFISHIDKEEFQRIWDNYLNYNFHTDKIEDCPTFINTVFSALKDIESNYPNENILVVGHSCLRYAFDAFFDGLPKSGILPHKKLNNCETIGYKKASL